MGTFHIDGTLSVKNNLKLWSDAEGANIRFITANDSNKVYELDTNSGNLRLYYCTDGGTGASGYKSWLFNPDGSLTAVKFIGSLQGNADTATKLKTARTISLTGSVTGSGSFDGSGNLSIATTTNHNHDSLYPKKDGTGATGNWAISSRGLYSVDTLETQEETDAFMEGSCLLFGRVTAAGDATINNDGMIISLGYSSGWGAQIWLDDGSAYPSMKIRNRSGTSSWHSWASVLTSNNYSSYALPLSGGTLSGTLKWSNNLTQVSSPTVVAAFINNNSANGLGFCYTSSITAGAAGHVNNTRSVSGNTHAEALKNEFTNYKSSIPRNSLLTYYSSAYGNGSFYQGYFLSGYDSNPYGGFFVAHYGTPYYVGILSGNFIQSQLWKAGDAITGAVWNDYAEYRESKCDEPGYVLIENGDDTLSKSTERLQSFAGISSDTWGFSQGQTEKAKTPIAVAGRVLAYTYQDRNNYKPGDCVCAAPGGTVDIMTREEVRDWPDRIIGTVSCVPDYEEWGGGEGADRDPVKVNNRIWIKIK